MTTRIERRPKMNSNWTIKNSPFEILGEAFKILFPDVEYEADITPNVPEIEKGESFYALTQIDMTGTTRIYINSEIPISKAFEAFAHELVHLGAGTRTHGKKWKQVNNNLREVYNDISHKLFMERLFSKIKINVPEETISADKSFSMEIEPPECLDINQKEGDSKNGN